MSASLASLGSASRGDGNLNGPTPNGLDSTVTPVNDIVIDRPSTSYECPSAATPETPGMGDRRHTTLSHVFASAFRRWYTAPRVTPGAPCPGAPVNPCEPGCSPAKVDEYASRHSPSSAFSRSASSGTPPVDLAAASSWSTRSPTYVRSSSFAATPRSSAARTLTSLYLVASVAAEGGAADRPGDGDVASTDSASSSPVAMDSASPQGPNLPPPLCSSSRNRHIPTSPPAHPPVSRPSRPGYLRKSSLFHFPFPT